MSYLGLFSSVRNHRQSLCKDSYRLVHIKFFFAAL